MSWIRVSKLDVRFYALFTVLYATFLTHSILNHHSWSFPTKIFKNIYCYSGFYCTCFKRPILGYSFIQPISSKFYSKSWSLIKSHKNFFKYRILLGFCSTYFKRSGLEFSNYGLNFKHSFTMLYTAFLRHSSLNHQAWSFPTKISKNVERYSVFARSSNDRN